MNARLVCILRDGWPCPTIQLFSSLELNIALLPATADRYRITIIAETGQDLKLDIHLYNNKIRDMKTFTVLSLNYHFGNANF